MASSSHHYFQNIKVMAHNRRIKGGESENIFLFVIVCLFVIFWSGDIHAQDSFPRPVDLPPAKPIAQAETLQNQPEIDGKVDFERDARWIPLLQDLSGASDPSVLGWGKVGWNDKGLYIAAVIPSARPDQLMNTGRTPDAPFVLNLSIDVQQEPEPGHPGRHHLRFLPLTHQPDKMLYRNQGFLFNHRLGFGSRLVDEGLVVWGERSLSGIEGEGLKTQWAFLENKKTGREEARDEARQKGMSVEVFIPWRNLQGAQNPVQTGLFFDMGVNLSGNRSASWTGDLHKKRDTGGRLKLLSSDEAFSPPLFKKRTLLLHTRHNVWMTDDTVDVFYPTPGMQKEDYLIGIADASGKTVLKTSPDAGSNQSLMHGRFWIGDLDDGPYTLRLEKKDSKEVVAEKSVYIGGDLIQRITEKRKTLLSRKDSLEQDNVSWRTGQLARAEWLLNEIDISGSADHRRLNEAQHSLQKARDILEASGTGGCQLFPSRRVCGRRHAGIYGL